MSALFEAKRLTKRFHDNGNVITAVDDVSFSVDCGDVTGFLGLNGAGKTTTLKMITGLVIPDSGEMFFNGVPFADIDPAVYRQNVYILLEGNRNLWWKLTVDENIRFVSNMLWQNYRGVKDLADHYLHRLHLHVKKNSLVANLSRGMQQKLCIILAAISPAKLVLMDEPTLGMDVESRQEAIEFIHDAVAEHGNKAFIITSHDLDFIGRIANKVIIMKGGKIIADAPMKQLAPMFAYGDYFMKVETTPDVVRALPMLQQRFALNNINQNKHEVGFDFFMKTPDVFYDLIGEFQRLGAKVTSFGPQTPDFEEMFLRIVRGRNL